MSNDPVNPSIDSVGPVAIRTVVVPLDGSLRSERALPHAVSVAERAGAGIVLITTSWEGDSTTPRAYLAAKAAGLGERCEDTFTIADAHPAAAILDVARAVDDPLVVMCTHGRGGVAATVLGSVAEAVVRELHLPVALIGAHCESAAQLATAKDVVLCFDESPLSEAIVPIVAAWAERFELHPWILEVSTSLSEAKPEANERRAVELVRLRDALSRFGTAADWDIVRDEHVPRGILRWADKVRPAWIVMSTHGATGMNRLALGSFTAAVVHEARCPVLAVHPRAVHGWWDRT